MCLNKPMPSEEGKKCYREVSVFISQGLPYIPYFNEVSSANLREGVVALFLFVLWALNCRMLPTQS